MDKYICRNKVYVKYVPKKNVINILLFCSWCPQINSYFSQLTNFFCIIVGCLVMMATTRQFVLNLVLGMAICWHAPKGVASKMTHFHRSGVRASSSGKQGRQRRQLLISVLKYSRQTVDRAITAVSLAEMVVLLGLQIVSCNFRSQEKQCQILLTLLASSIIRKVQIGIGAWSTI